MLRAIRKYIEQYDLLQPAAPVIVGLSGGADSVALIHVLNRLNYRCVAAHCNFHLRGAEADRDETFARQIAESLQIPFEKKDFDTVGYAESHGVSIEMAARELRYQWFEMLRTAYHAQAIAVAHHQDDSIETVLMNLIRGTGIGGLHGIRPKNGFIVRPLMAVNRSRIEAWLEEEKLTFRQDSTNFSDAYTRNVIRRQLLPLMEKINPSVREAVLRTSKHLSDIELIYRSTIEKERARLLDDQERISISALLESAAPQTVLYELIKPYGFTRILSETVFNSLQGESGRTFSAPDAGYHILKDRNHLILYRTHERDNTIYPVEVEGILGTPINLRTEVCAIDSSFIINKHPHVATFDRDKLTLPLTLRTWRPGDSFVPFGMNGRQKLSDYFSDHKFNRLRKEQTWLLCSGEEIVWIVGERTDHRYRVETATKNVLIATVF
ncbi:tRNA lysidine(34) synthetase TilS [Tannerella sp.]|uniref:tRNA lysidine(34) synthetase TilS n=1 Tax=Tannerella sp. TaxID=2382127 RepID=UPI0026DBEA63|nr:tRNA lysidine(34) synthetase TilS [Tannerella sp.]MDO4703597.1 tRNA lysidine(34) synthetase TilS [Tannerella sp.]